MPRLRRSALLPYPVTDVFAIVNDVERYPEFLPWCKSVSVLVNEPESVVATLAVEAKGIREHFTTSNTLVTDKSIRLSLVEGPFSHFSGEWRFSEVGGNQGCKVELDLDFGFSGARSLLANAFKWVFSGAADSLVDAFCERAHELLGR